ncbi:hypothetical protein DFH07DRAFT_753617, partial [Mycena maculata]
VVTRVFMLFKNISSDELADWVEALHPNSEDVAGRWAGVAGIDVERALDVNLFRVLEWGGM